jgi:hypothetical protein
MVQQIRRRKRITLGADKAYDHRKFVDHLPAQGITPHMAQYTGRRSSAINRRTTRHAGYEKSRERRKRIEQVFGWLKTVGGLRKTRHRGRALVESVFTFACVVYKLVRIAKLSPRGPVDVIATERQRITGLRGRLYRKPSRSPTQAVRRTLRDRGVPPGAAHRESARSWYVQAAFV